MFKSFQRKGIKTGFPIILSVTIFASLLCASAVANAQTGSPFIPADQVSYVTRSTQNNGPTALYKVGMIDKSSVLIAPLISNGNEVKVNGIGYNINDNFIYGAYNGSGSSTSTTGTNDIVKIDAAGNTEIINVPGLPVDFYDAGDVDANGNLYLYKHSTTKIYKINLTTLAVTAITLNASSNFTDISVSDDGNTIWGLSANNGNFVTYNINNTSTATSLSVAGLSTGVATISFFDERKNLFFISEASGKVYLSDKISGSTGVIINTGNDITYYQTDGAQPRNKSVYNNNQPAFDCETGVGYVFSNDADDMYQVNSATSSYTLVANDITSVAGGDYNNLGYNAKDGYMWMQRTGTKQIVRMGSDFSMQYFNISELPTTVTFNAGDIDSNGVFFLMDGQGTNSFKIIYKIDLNPNSPTYLSYLGSVATNITLSAITDLAINPKDDNLYGVSNAGNLIRINPNTGVATNLGATGVTVTTSIILAFMDKNGTMYFQPSGSNKMYKITDTHLGNTIATTFKTNVTVINNGDAARCYLSSFDPDVPLAMELTSFNGTTNGCDAIINWTVANTDDLQQFDIEYSADGTEFTKIGEEKAAKSNYTFKYTQTSETGYYRLKMKDNAGNSAFSHVINVKTSCNGSHIKLYPNPVMNTLKIQGLDNNSIVRIYNINGQILSEIQHTSGQSIKEINMGNYPAGTYLIKVMSSNGYNGTYKVIKQ